MKCCVCEKTIKGNAAEEHYDEAKQEYSFKCVQCESVFQQAIRLFPTTYLHHELRAKAKSEKRR